MLSNYVKLNRSPIASVLQSQQRFVELHPCRSALTYGAGVRSTSLHIAEKLTPIHRLGTVSLVKIANNFLWLFLTLENAGRAKRGQ